MDYYDLSLILISVISSYGWYNTIPQKKHIYKGLVFLLFLDTLTTFLFYIFDIHFNLSIIFINILYLFLLYFIFVLSKIKSNKINKNNVCLIFYKPKTIMQSLKMVVASFGLLINGKIYQMRYEADTLQEREYTNKYIHSKYLVIDTKFKCKNLKENWREELLKQKRITCFGFWRLNCLKSCKIVLNQIKGFEYKKEILPSIYLFKKIISKK